MRVRRLWRRFRRTTYRENRRRFEGCKLLEMAGLYVFGWLYRGAAGSLHEHCMYMAK